MKNRTVRSILADFQEVKNSSAIPRGSKFTILIVVDGSANAVSPNTVHQLVEGLADEVFEENRHTVHIHVITVSQLTLDVVGGLTLLAVIDHSSSNFWADDTMNHSVHNALSTACFLLSRVVSDLVY